MDRRLFTVIAVVGFHVLGLWALQTGLLRRAVELVVPVEVLAELIEPPQPQVTPTPPQPPQPQQPQPVQKPVTPPKPVLRQAPQPLAIADPSPSPSPLAPTGTTEPQPPAPPMLAPVVVAEPAPPAPPKIVLPSSSADYLNNAPPPYPPLSKRMSEQGKVIVRAFIEVNGTASKAEIRTSSGFERLDSTALQTVLKWRYVPGKRAGNPEAMWFNIPINFVLE
ncbi:MAG: energy transducer TonB [Hydrogenophaga sp.]